MAFYPFRSSFLASLMLAGCAATPLAQAVPVGPWEQVALGWRGDDGGSTLRIVNPDGSIRLSITCSLAQRRLLASVPTFTPVGSEDRFNLVFGPHIVTLVADPTRQEAGTGVTAEGAIPYNIRELLSPGNQVSANYGNQTLDSHVPPPADLADGFADACERARQS